MKNLLTLIALCVSLSGVAASVLREEMRCYLGLTSQSCTTSEKPTLPVSSPQKSTSDDPKPSKSLTKPKAIQPSSEKSVISEPNEVVSPPDTVESPPDVPSQPIEAARTLDPNPPLQKLPVSVEDLRKRDLEASKNAETNPIETEIPLSVEPYESSPE